MSREEIAFGVRALVVFILIGILVFGCRCSFSFKSEPSGSAKEKIVICHPTQSCSEW